MKKRIFLTLLFVLTMSSISYGDLLDAYPQNTDPLVTDEAIGLDNPGGTWEVMRFAFGDILTLYLTQDLAPSGAFDTTGTTATTFGPLNFTAGATLPDTAGQFRYNSGVTGLSGNTFTFYDTVVNYILNYKTLPDTTGQVPTYNATTDVFDWEIPAGGGTNITEEATDPSFSTMDTGDLIVSIDSGDMFYKSATGGYTYTGVYTVDSCAGGSTGALGESGASAGSGSSVCTGTCPDNVLYYSEFVAGASNDGETSYVHGELEAVGQSVRMGIWTTGGVLLASCAEFEGGDTSGEEVHKALTAGLCLVDGTTYRLGIWIEADAWASVHFAGTFGANSMSRLVMPTFGDMSGTPATESANFAIRMTVNTTAGAF